MDLKLTKAALATTQAALDSQLTKRATYRRYFDYSNDLEINEQIATQGKVARSVWETGGSAGQAHQKSHSHWKDSKVFADRFDKWGRSCLKTVLKHPRFDTKRDNYVVAEYGPGGGAVLSAFQPSADKLLGFDISEINLNETSRVIGDKFIPVFVKDDLSNLTEFDASVDVFLSFNVIQHFPSKAYTEQVVQFIGNAVKPNGIAFLQIRFDNGNPAYGCFSLDEYDSVSGHTYANAIRIDLFNSMLIRAGFTVDFIGQITSKNGVTFWATKGGRLQKRNDEAFDRKADVYRY